jgi:hypothetical protein
MTASAIDRFQERFVFPSLFPAPRDRVEVGEGPRAPRASDNRLDEGTEVREAAPQLVPPAHVLLFGEAFLRAERRRRRHEALPLLAIAPGGAAKTAAASVCPASGISPTEASCERAFSAVKFQVGKHRSSAQPDLVEACVVVTSAKGGCNFTFRQYFSSFTFHIFVNTQKYFSPSIFKYFFSGEFLFTPDPA